MKSLTKAKAKTPRQIFSRDQFELIIEEVGVNEFYRTGVVGSLETVETAIRGWLACQASGRESCLDLLVVPLLADGRSQYENGNLYRHSCYPKKSTA